MRLFFLFLSLLIAFSCCNRKTDTELIQTQDAKTTGNSLQDEVAEYPDSLVLLSRLLEQYTNDENYDKALSALKNAISRDSTNPELWDMQSVVLAAKGDTANSIKSLEKAIQIYPLPLYIISLGALYAETKNQRALQLADILLEEKRSPAVKEAYFIKGLYYSFTNQKLKAISFFDKSLGIDFQFMDAYLEKGLALYELKKYNDAAAVFTKAVTLQNNFDRGYYYLGQSYEKLNKKTDAREAYEKAILYDPNYEEAKNALEKLDR